MNFFEQFVNAGNTLVWSTPGAFPLIVALLLGTGLFVTFRLAFIQVRAFGHGWKVISGKFDDPSQKGDISHFQALTTALSATVGVGNIAGVATAIHYGGPGALFWMWLTAFFGMALKYVECTLAMQHRVFDEKGESAGGPMYYIERGMGKNWKPLAVFFAFCAVISSFGSGNMNQANTVSLSATSTLGVPTWISGLVMAAVVALVIIGGIKRIGAVTSKLAPAMFILYSLGALVIILKNAGAIPAAFQTILTEAFNPTAGFGGTAAGAFMTTLVWGVKRGLFSNEAGQGSAPIAHAAAKTDKPVREGMVAMLGPFIDTLVICSMTGLCIVLTGAWNQHKSTDLDFGTVTVHEVSAAPSMGDRPGASPLFDGTLRIQGGAPQGGAFENNDGYVLNPQLLDEAGVPFSGSIEVSEGVITGGAENLTASGDCLQNSSALTTWAFERELGDIGKWIVTLSVFLFAVSTTISWSYYGDRCAEYLFGIKAVPIYRWIYVGFIFLGATLALEVVWGFGDMALGLMAAPNLIAILWLTSRVKKSTDDYYNEGFDKKV